MVSFLMDCPQCGMMIPKGGPCESCRWSEGGATDAIPVEAMMREYSRRNRTHVTNFAIYMLLMFGTGLVGLLTAYMWFKVMYLGDIVAFVLIGFLTVFTGVLSLLLAFAKKVFPVDLNCPACDIRLDELGTDGGHCPNCSVQLK